MEHVRSPASVSREIPVMSRAAVAIVLLATWSSAARAQLDAEVDKPYHLRVALRVAQHRALTTVFKKQLQDELHDSLQSVYGALADVQVLDMNQPDELAKDPLLKRVADDGLQLGLDGPQPLGQAKTHFVFVDFEDGQYKIAARQHDGLTGLASPVVRRAQTTDRLLVARWAALLVNQDFGLVGTFGMPAPDGKVTVRLKGGGLGVPLQAWAHKGEVFAVAVLAKDATGVLRSERVPWAVLQVEAEPEKDTCACHFYYRKAYDNRPLPSGPQVLGYRCLKLGTITAPLRLRFISLDKTGTPQVGLQVEVSEHGFQDKPRSARATNSDGRVQFEPFSNLAFVRVLNSSGTPVARLPVEILGDRLVVCEVEVSSEGDLVGALVDRRNRLLKQVYETLQQQSVVLKEIQGLKSREEALERAKDGLAALDKEANNLRDLVGQLRQDARGKERVDLTECERGLEALRTWREPLQRSIKDLQEIIKVENDPRLRGWKEQVYKAKGLEAEAEYGQALAIYEKVLKEGAQDEELRKQVEDLRRRWETKSDEHRKAREFIYGTWAQAEDVAAMKEHLAEARKAFEVCRGVGDVLTVKKLLRVNVAHTVALQKEQERLQGNTADELQKAKNIKEVAEGLQGLLKDAAAFVRSASGDGP
jgi:hypothetical protein